MEVFPDQAREPTAPVPELPDVGDTEATGVVEVMALTLDLDTAAEG